MKNKNRLYCLLYLVFFGVLAGCVASKPNQFNKRIGQQIETDETFQRYFLGFKLYDIASKTTLYEHNSDKYFAPASNTKLFTFYACLNYLKDSIPAFKYAINNDSLIIWGSGDPTFLHPDFKPNKKIFDFIKNHFGPVVVSNRHYYNERFGPGWAWDDYPYYFSAETAALPIYGNVVRFFNIQRDNLQLQPAIFSDSSQALRPFETIKSTIWRSESKNLFKYKPTAVLEEPKDIPIYFTSGTLIKLLEDTLQRPISTAPIPIDSINNKLYSIGVDTVYRRMLQESDNFLAEQLLLLCASEALDSLSTEAIIRHTTENLMFDFPDQPIWKDGSGLSRYNLFTPRTIVTLLEKIYAMVPEERLFSLMPIGGERGTIENWYHGNPPYVFAKTGTFSNNHSLSGYLVTTSGKRLIFSFMHNNYPHASGETKKAMTPILEYIRDNY